MEKLVYEDLCINVVIYIYKIIGLWNIKKKQKPSINGNKQEHFRRNIKIWEESWRNTKQNALIKDEDERSGINRKRSSRLRKSEELQNLRGMWKTKNWVT